MKIVLGSSMRYRAPRRPTDRKIKVLLGAKEVDATLRNYSLTGLCIADLPPLGPGAQISIRVLQNAWVASIVWSRGALTGAKFVRPLTQRELAFFQSKARASQYASWDRYASGPLRS